MRASSNCYELIKYFETCWKPAGPGMFEAYPDPQTGDDPWTIGWGHTGPEVHLGLKWTQDQCDDALVEDVMEFEELVLDHFEPLGMTQNEFDALVSIVYNVGPGSGGRDGIIRLRDGRPSTLRRTYNSGEKSESAYQFLKWVSPGSATERGLTRRRIAEKALFEGKPWLHELRIYLAAGG